MSTSISPKERKRLKEALALSFTKKSKVDNLGTSSSIAYSESGNAYIAGSIESDSNLLHVSSEQAVLALATHHNDFTVNRIVTLFENEKNPVSPITLKILIDWYLRTNREIHYTVINLEGIVLFDEPNLRRTLFFYDPTPITLSKVGIAQISEPIANSKRVTPALLRHYALQGLQRNFPTYDSASGYGAVVATKKGKVYFGGQYSSLEKRTGLHAEMAVLTGALMSGMETITHLGLVSSKHADTPCFLCGSCRQFLAELEVKCGFTLKIYCFAKDAPDYTLRTTKELLPDMWTSKKWR